MKAALPNPGTYLARRTGPIVIEAKETGSLLCWIPYTLCNSEVQHIGRHMETIGQKDGTLKLKSVANLKAIFGWDGVNPFDLENIPIPMEGKQEGEPEFELADCIHDDSYTPPDAQEPVIQFKASWLNAIGGTQNMPAPLDEAARKQVLARWSAKFKATSGGKAAPAQTPKAPAQPAKPAHAGPPSRGKGNATSAARRTMTQEEVWETFEKANDGVSQDELGVKFYAAQDKLFPGANGELTIQQWGEVATELGI